LAAPAPSAERRELPRASRACAERRGRELPGASRRRVSAERRGRELPRASRCRARAERRGRELPRASRCRARAERRGSELPGASRGRACAERRELPGASRGRARAERRVRARNPRDGPVRLVESGAASGHSALAQNRVPCFWKSTAALFFEQA